MEILISIRKKGILAHHFYFLYLKIQSQFIRSQSIHILINLSTPNKPLNRQYDTTLKLNPSTK